MILNREFGNPTATFQIMISKREFRNQTFSPATFQIIISKREFTNQTFSSSSRSENATENSKLEKRGP
jgi:hypothetical protein